MALSPTPTAVVEGFLTKWAATTALNNLIPNERVYLQRTPETTELPAAAVSVSMQGVDYNTGAACILNYEIAIEFFFTVENNSADGLLSAVASAFSRTSSDATAGLTITGGTVMRTDVGNFGYGLIEGNRHGIFDVVQGTVSIQLQIQGSID